MIDQAPAPVLATNPSRWVIHCADLAFQPGETRPVPLEFVTMWGHTGLKFDYSNLADMLRTHEAGKIAVDFWAPLSVVDGYGRHALAIWNGLLKLGVRAALRSNGRFVDLNYLPPEYNQERLRNQFSMPCRVALAMTVPYDPMLIENNSVVKIAITQFETDHFPKYHVGQVNQADCLITTSKFQPRMLKKSGVKVPIHVMQVGVDTDFFSFRPRLPDGKFKILLLGAVTSRKNPEGAIRIFQAASEGHPDWSLTIKTRGDTRALRRLRRVVAEDIRIKLDLQETSPGETLNYYYNHDCLLWPSKGEGIGLPPLEAMATGMEVVMSKNSGMADYAFDDICWPIKTAFKEPAGWPKNPEGFAEDYITSFGDVGNWWVPNELHGTRQLQRCFHAWSHGRGKGPRAAEYIRARRTLRHQAASVLEVIERYVGASSS